MTLYVLYNADGSIHQANKVYLDPDDTNYDKLMNERGDAFLKITDMGNFLPSHDAWLIANGQLTERQEMTANAPTTIQAGTAAIVTDIPKGANVIVSAVNSVVYNIPALDGDELEFNTETVPITYTITLMLWPWKTKIITIKAV